jgi:YD repeat-containing protein
VKWIETSGSSTVEYRYTYDSEEQLTRQERYIDGKTNFASTSEYDAKKSPYTTPSPFHKGHPIIPSSYANNINKNNVVRSMQYNGNAAGNGWDLSNSSISVFEYNASWFPVSSTIKQFNEDGVENGNGTGTYEYKSCI